MLLRESSRMLGLEVDVDAVVDDGRLAADGDYGFPAAAELLAFASAANRVANPAMAAGGDDAEAGVEAVATLTAAREKLVVAVGPDGLLEAAATVAAFNGLVRVADGTGIELDDAMIVVSSGIRSHLGLDSMAGAANTRRLDAPPTVDIGPVDSDRRVRSLFADRPT